MGQEINKDVKDSICNEFARLLNECGITDQLFLGGVSSWETIGSDEFYLKYLKGFTIKNLTPVPSS